MYILYFHICNEFKQKQNHYKIHAYKQRPIIVFHFRRHKRPRRMQHRLECIIIAPHLPHSPLRTPSDGNFAKWGASLWSARRSRAHCIIQYRLSECKLRSNEVSKLPSRQTWWEQKWFRRRCDAQCALTFAKWHCAKIYLAKQVTVLATVRKK